MARDLNFGMMQGVMAYFCQWLVQDWEMEVVNEFFDLLYGADRQSRRGRIDGDGEKVMVVFLSNDPNPSTFLLLLRLGTHFPEEHLEDRVS